MDNKLGTSAKTDAKSGQYVASTCDDTLGTDDEAVNPSYT